MKDYREVQVSTTVLVFIILGIIILGTVIFFMGVQVGKKQSELAAQSLMATKTEEKVNQDKPVPPAEETSASPAQTQAVNPAEAPAKTIPAVTSDTTTEVRTPPTEASTPTSPPSSAAGSVVQAEKSVARVTSSVEKPVSSPAQSSGGSYFIQVGAFNDLSSARLAADRFNKQGYKTVVKDPYPSDRRPVYRVWVGGYATREEARKVMDEIARKSVKNPGYFVVHQ